MKIIKRYFNRRKKMKEKIEKELKNIIGAEIKKVYRFKEMLCLEFKKADTVYHLHLQCPFKICLNTKIVVASFDIYVNIEETNGETQKSIPDSLFDIKAKKILKSEKFIVKDVIVNDFGEFTIAFNNQYMLQTFNDTGINKEIYRLFSKSNKGDHFVVYGNEIKYEQYDIINVKINNYQKG